MIYEFAIGEIYEGYVTVEAENQETARRLAYEEYDELSCIDKATSKLTLAKIWKEPEIKLLRSYTSEDVEKENVIPRDKVFDYGYNIRNYTPITPQEALQLFFGVDERVGELLMLYDDDTESVVETADQLVYGIEHGLYFALG